MFRKNVASQNVAAQMNSRSDGSPLTSGVSVYVNGNGGTQSAGGGTLTHEGNGAWNYVPTQAETNYNHVAYTFVHATGINQTVQVWPVSFDPTDSVRMGMTALPNATPASNNGLPTVDANNRVVGIQGTKNTLDSLNDLTAAQVNAEVDSALNTAVPGTPTAGSINERIKSLDENYTSGRASNLDNLDATVSSRSSHAAADIWSVGSRTLTSFGTLVSDIWNNGTRTLTGFSTALAVAVWDVLETAVTTASSIGLKLKNNLDAAVSSRATASVCTEGRLSELDAGTGGKMANQIDEIRSDTEDIQDRVPAALVGGRIDASVGAMANAVITAAAIASGALTRDALAADTGLQSIRSNTAQAGTAGSITLDASASAVNDFYEGAVVLLTGGTGAGQARIIIAYNGTTKVASVAPDWATNPASGTTFAILPLGDIYQLIDPEPTAFGTMTRSRANFQWALLKRFYMENTQTSAQQKTKNDDLTDFATRATSDNGTTQTVGEAS